MNIIWMVQDWFFDRKLEYLRHHGKDRFIGIAKWELLGDRNKQGIFYKDPKTEMWWFTPDDNSCQWVSVGGILRKEFVEIIHIISIDKTNPCVV